MHGAAAVCGCGALQFTGTIPRVCKTVQAINRGKVDSSRVQQGSHFIFCGCDQPQEHAQAVHHDRD
eukprot:3874521-Rhodomonas_salina.12